MYSFTNEKNLEAVWLALKTSGISALVTPIRLFSYFDVIGLPSSAEEQNTVDLLHFTFHTFIFILKTQIFQTPLPPRPSPATQLYIILSL